MQYVASAAKRQSPPLTMRDRIDKFNEWSSKPMSKRAEIIIPAVLGSIMFWLYFAIVMFA